MAADVLAVVSACPIPTISSIKGTACWVLPLIVPHGLDGELGMDCVVVLINEQIASMVDLCLLEVYQPILLGWC